ncbi:SCL-interrupting locus protein homolog [Xenentodon cancila]
MDAGRPVNLQAPPGDVLREAPAPEVRGRTSVNFHNTQLSFPKSRSALWDSSPTGEKIHLQLCSHRKPRVLLLEKALRLAQRHTHHSNKPRLHFFFLGSVSVDADEEGIVVTLDRFDPGREQVGSSGRVPSALLPGDALVPCLFSSQPEVAPEAVVQSEAELHQCFKALQQFVSSRQTLDLSQLLKISARMVCSQQSDTAAVSLCWSAICPAVSVDVQPVRAVPIIPTALLRSLISIGRQLQPPSRQRGFLTMDQTRKLVLLLESDPKASSLPLVGLWLSGVTHVYNPQVFAWSLRFIFSSSLKDRVLSESGCFLLVVFGTTHRTPQFFQCRGFRQGPAPGLGPQLDCQLLTASQSFTLYQKVPQVDGRSLQCELGSEDRSRQAEVFRVAQSSFSSTPPAAAGLSISEQDSGVEDEDFSPRPSPSPHPPATQRCRLQPSVPELSLLMDNSFTFNHGTGQDTSPAHKPSPSDMKPAPPICSISTSLSTCTPSAAPDRHSTPNSNLQQPCMCCSTQTNNCASIFASPVLLPAAAPPLSHQHSSPSSHHSAPTPPSSHQNTLPSSKIHSTPCPSFQQSAPPSSKHSGPLPVSSYQKTPFSPLSTPSLPSSHHYTRLPSSSPPSTPLASTCQAVLPPFSHLAPSPSHHHKIPQPTFNHHPSPSFNPSTSLSTHHHTPPSSRLSAPAPPLAFPPASSCACSHRPPPPHLLHPASADPASPPWLPQPSCFNRCCDQVGTAVPSDTFQLLLHQDHQLRLLQAQVQMLLEAQRKLQSSTQQVDTQTSRSTASIAVETGASLFWGNGPVQTPPRQDEQAPLSSSPKPSSSLSSSPSTLSHDPATRSPVGGAEDGDITEQVANCSLSGQHSIGGLQTPVLGESVSMYGPAEEEQEFYQNLMSQLNSLLHESDSKQEAEESNSKSPSVSQSSQSSQTSSSFKRKKEQWSPEGDPVIRATLQQLQKLGVDMNQRDLTETEKDQVKAVESASTLASINPAAVVSRLGVSESTVSALFPGGSVDLSLEANAIALRYLSDFQLSRLSLGDHAPRDIPAPSSSRDSLLSPSNMSLATRKYMRKYGLIEEEEQEEVGVQEASARQPLTEALNVKLLPQSQLIRDLRPKMELLATSSKPNTDGKENCSSRRPRPDQTSSRQSEGSVGNILDLSRLRQLPKLF